MNAGIAWLCLVLPAGADDLFESQIRPVLMEHCQSCHGAQKQRAGLRLDSAAGLKRGSDNGPIVLPGDPARSPMIRALRHEGALRMPPRGKLPEATRDAFARWVQEGAHWPEPVDGGSGPRTGTPARTHWAFQPVRASEQPAGAPTEIDAYIQARLQAAGLTIAQSADRRTLLRRATFDLHGLPPTPAEVESFVGDPSPDAFVRVVDRLLASPRYGQRWGRHWLDVARYADTKGYVRLKDNPLYVASWTYRDWVIRAFNEDMPYDRFVVHQLAADLLPDDDPGRLAAMGFLTLGQRFVNSTHDIIDDRIDVVTRGLMGLTVACARCHDHKFDPVPTRDYYALHGVFASSIEPRSPPLLLRPEERTGHTAYLKELQARTDAFDQFLVAQRQRLTVDFLARAGDYLLAGQKEEVQANFLAVMFLIDASKDLNPVEVQRWARLLAQSRRATDPVLTPWHDLAALPTEAFAARSSAIIAAWRTPAVNPVVRAALAEPLPRDLADVAKRYGQLIREADRRSRAGGTVEPAWAEIHRLVPDVSPFEIEEYLFVDTTTQNQYHDHQRRVEDWIASPGAAPHAHTLADAPSPVEPRVFRRGNPSNPGEAVPRQFLTVLSPAGPRPFRQGSGRLELARAIASPDNPLTARVMVNRVWMHHFGQGFVRTPGDFGLRGEPPTHPQLLDWLAGRFVADGWSVKSLHRRIMLSATYQQSSRATPRVRESDPENRLWGRANRRRLDAESLRDALLAVAGRLDQAAGGPGFDLAARPAPGRRSIYALVDRQNLSSTLRTFDFAPPDTSTPQRHETTVPQQALFLLNSPFLEGITRTVAARPDLVSAPDPGARIDRLHQLLYGRPASLAEVALGRGYLTGAVGPARSSDLTVWEEYVQVLLLANEFAYVD